eukprot:Filipodium_phascolosomae@DN2570_c0_g1_i1.p1
MLGRLSKVHQRSLCRKLHTSNNLRLEYVKVCEVGPRDGLQNLKKTIDTQAKLRLIQMLADAGLPHIEATAFVSPQAVPQMADHTTLMAQLEKIKTVPRPIFSVKSQISI